MWHFYKNYLRNTVGALYIILFRSGQKDATGAQQTIQSKAVTGFEVNDSTAAEYLQHFVRLEEFRCSVIRTD